MCAAGVGAPHIRQRLFWVANSNEERRSIGEGRARPPGQAGGGKPSLNVGRMADGLQPGNEEIGHKFRTKPDVKRGGPWSDYVLIPFPDGKARRIKPGIMPLAHGVPARVGKIRAYGNAIVSQIAAEFIMSFMEYERKRGLT